MTEDESAQPEIGQQSEWRELAAGETEVINLTPEGRSEVMGGEVVAKIRLGSPPVEVHIVSVHSPNEHFSQLLRLNGVDPSLSKGIVLLALNEASKPQSGIEGSALLMPGQAYGLGGNGNLRWVKYGTMADPREPWTPFNDNPSLQGNNLRVDTAAEHLVIEPEPNSTIPVQLSKQGLY